MAASVDDLFEAVTGLASAVEGVKQDRRRDHRRVALLAVSVVFDIVLSVVLFLWNERLDDAQREARRAIETSRLSTCATDSLWLKLIADAPPATDPKKREQTEVFRKRFQDDYDANRCSELVGVK